NGVTGASNTLYPRFSSAPTGGVPLGTATGSAFISYSPFGPYAQDTFSHSPYTDYSTYCDPKPPDGTAPYCIPAIQHLTSYGTSGTVDYTVEDNLELKSISSYRRYSGAWSQDEDGSPLGDEELYHYGGRIDLGSFEFYENDLIPAKSAAGFLNAGWKIASKLELNVGARY